MLLAHPYDNSSFVNALMSAPWYANFINTYIAGGNGAIGNLNKSDLENQDVLVPCDQEKRKIGTFFLALDDLITLHQQKYDKLVNLKAAMLEKMFPKDSADVPEVRFHGFADAWEQCKLGSVYVERNERGNKNLPILSVSIHTGISNGELSRDDLGKQVRRSEDKSLYKHVMAGDLVFNMMRAWQGAIGVSSVEGMVSPAYITAASTCKLDSDFMDYTVKRKDIVNQIDNLSYGVTDFRKRLYWDSFVRVFCYFPEEPEQNKIGAFFRSLDDLITLHKRKLEKLRNIKQACLEKMFIS